MKIQESKIAVIGLGYVGLPLAIEFGKQFSVIGFDVNDMRIQELKKGVDSTLEVESDQFTESTGLMFSSTVDELSDCNVYIVTVPTPIDRYKKPDLRPLIGASEMLGEVLVKGDVIIYESTVFPGCTEEECIPVVERVSGLRYGEDFFAGYSPERINPGDKEHRVTDILKVTSGSNAEIAQFVDDLYSTVIKAGTHKAQSIRVAEAAKVIENTQRDLNIALINELAIIFEKLDIDTRSVLAAAGTKWNFLPFSPGLVGGHCISVDPYYLTHKAQEIGYHPEVILSGRKINDGMGSYVVDTVVKLMLKKRIQVVDANVLVLGLTFKENCPDLRNTRVIDIVNAFTDYNANIDVYDPWVDVAEAKREYGIDLLTKIEIDTYDAVLLCVAHSEFIELGAETVRSYCKDPGIVYDVKGVLDRQLVDGRL